MEYSKQTITVLMSHPQFYCKIFTLRHAWLNLQDKHMTTGRINQVNKELGKMIEQLPKHYSFSNIH